MIRPTKDLPDKSDIEIVSILKTKSVAKKSDLTYHIGQDEEANLYIRIWVNSSNGYFSNEWIPLTKILGILKQHSTGSFTSFVFEVLFSGKSVNTPAFLAAALIQEGVLKFDEGKKRKLVYTGAELKIDKPKPRKTIKKAARKSKT